MHPCDKGYTVTFKENSALIKNFENDIQFVANHKDNSYYLHISDSNVNLTFFASDSIDSSKNKFSDIMKWHARTGYLNFKDLSESCNKGNILGLNITKVSEEFN